MRRFLCLVLTSDPGSRIVTDDIVAAALDSVDGIAQVGTTRWLSPNEAWEAAIGVSGDFPLPALREAVRRAVGGAAVDANVVFGEPTTRRKRLLCADMESTIIEQELIDELATLAGRHDEISAITAAAMRGELDFAASLVQRVALFKGLDAKQLDGLFERITLMPGAEALVKAMRANGGRAALISGGFTVFAERVGARLGFDAVVANVLETEHGKLTGRVREPILGPQGKADALIRLAKESGIATTDTIAVGDGANDTAMLAAAGLGVAFRAKPILANAAFASENGAVIQHGNLTALLHLQGYACDRFVT